jgi:hypothetical protein
MPIDPGVHVEKPVLGVTNLICNYKLDLMRTIGSGTWTADRVYWRTHVGELVLTGSAL